MEGPVARVIMLATLTAGLISCEQVCFLGLEYDPRSGIPPRWFLPYKDPCKCTAIRLGGMNIPASSYLQGAPYYLDERIISEDFEEIKAFFKCPAECVEPVALGLEKRSIPDERISVSRARNDRPATNGRLNYPGWWGAESDESAWIQVDLDESKLVTGVITQGSTSGYLHRVTQYMVAYKTQLSLDFEHVTDANGNIKVFDGNLLDGSTPITNTFHQSIVAAVVRIEVVNFIIGVAMRLELLGCDYD